ncbi:ribonuclease H-like domain-containing protein [Haloimpatiens lingqiaonensis]|uniref:ribonuclease H-like domain-containing protein n=1 Tax=Haloimpatiens lingqiaonensis TaxID=1380675 RepID=UPI0010FD029C|nr:ribonuclease H-like domain-containing protein [Haloimpatiens lingqiaonensis]
MILREKREKISVKDTSFLLPVGYGEEFYKKALFFDLEHCVNKKPICVGVFGCSYYDADTEELVVNQYMIENKRDAEDVLYIAERYFNKMKNSLNKKYIVTFAGNNDFTVIDYLFKKSGIQFNIRESFKEIDLQKEYEKEKGSGIGLKNLEKEFNINRETEVIGGQNLAKTFSKIVKDSNYIQRMPDEKKEKILLYNEQDVVSLFQISLNWKKYIKASED